MSGHDNNTENYTRTIAPPAPVYFDTSARTTTSDELDASQSKATTKAVNFAEDVTLDHVDKIESMHAARQLLSTKLAGVRNVKATGHTDREVVEQAGIQGLLFPWHTSYRVWWAIMVSATILTAFFCPYTIAFEVRMGAFSKGSATIEFMLAAIFVLDIFVNFNRAFHVGEVLVYERSEIVKHYCRKLFWVDCVGVFPFSVVALAIAGEVGEDTNRALLISMLRLLQLVRLYRMYRFFYHLQYNAQVSLLYFTLLRNGTYARIFVCGFVHPCDILI